MTETNSPLRASLGTWRWILIASLALNVLIVGAVLSALCVGHFGRPPGGPEGGGRGSPLLGFARTLPRERADIIRQAVANAQPNLETLRRGVRDARASVRTALSAEPFDQAKFDTAMDGIVQADANEARGKATLFAEVVKQLIPEERIKLREWLESRRPLR